MGTGFDSTGMLSKFGKDGVSRDADLDFVDAFIARSSRSFRNSSKRLASAFPSPAESFPLFPPAVPIPRRLSTNVSGSNYNFEKNANTVKLHAMSQIIVKLINSFEDNFRSPNKS